MGNVAEFHYDENSNFVTAEKHGERFGFVP